MAILIQMSHDLNNIITVKYYSVVINTTFITQYVGPLYIILMNYSETIISLTALRKKFQLDDNNNLYYERNLHNVIYHTIK